MAAGPFCFTILFCFFTSCLLLLFFFFFPVQSADYFGVAYHDCLHNATSTHTNASVAPSSTFQSNLNSAVQGLAKLASSGAAFAIASAHAHSLCFSTSHNLSSSGPLCETSTISASSDVDTAFAMFQCRGDQSSHDCARCVANATATLSQSLCPSSIGARIQLDGCYFRYDNQTFFTPDFNFVLGYCYVPTNDTVVLTAIDSLVSYVTSQAPDNNGYASKSASSEYALAQCQGYLNDSECYQCLHSYSYRLVCNQVLGEQVHLGSCYFRFEPYLFFNVPMPAPPSNSLQAPASPPPAPAALKAPTKGSKVAVVAGSVVGAFVFVIAALCVTLLALHRQRDRKGSKIPENESFPQLIFEPKAEVFSLHDLEVATRHFHVSNKLGEGGFGSVFKGTLRNEQEVAVKKLSLGSRQGKQEFINEVRLLTTVQHKNLIKLLGSCVEGPERILVYEYLPNGSLDRLLFGNDKKKFTLDWRTRHNIILGIARGLAYLHEESQVRIIHRDIKPSNILLSDSLNPVIADFGLARLDLGNESHMSTRVVGSIGYLAPEYMTSGKLTEKVDVFSFGVVTLEIITGRKNSYGTIAEEIWTLRENQQEMEFVDPRLGTSFCPEEVIRAIHIALLCVQADPNRRPNMSSVTFLLSGNSDIFDKPGKPAFAYMSPSKQKVFASQTCDSMSPSKV